MLKKKNRGALSFSTVISLSLVLLILVSPCLAEKKAGPTMTATIATHTKGSLLNTLGSGIAKVLSLHTGISAVDRPFTSYNAWVPMVNKGQLDMGISSANEAYYAFKGQVSYRDKHEKLRVISGGSTMSLTFVVRADSGIKKMSDLKGKRVGFDASSRTIMQLQKTVLKAAGLDPEKDVIGIPVAGIMGMVNAFIEGRSDATWASVGMAKIMEASAKLGGVHWLSVCNSSDDAAANMIKEELQGIDVKFFKGGKVPGVKNDVWALDNTIVLISSTAYSDEAAYFTAKTLWENQKELTSIHPIFRAWHKGMVKESVGKFLPYHPGSVRFFKEAGAWTERMEQFQKQF